MKSKKPKKSSRAAALDWGTVAGLVHELLELAPAERRARLTVIGRQSKELKREVEELLATSRAVERFLEDPIGPRAIRSLKPATALEPGQQVGEFRILRELGRGAFATVYLAEQESLGRAVALKVSADSGREARTMAHLEHDNVVKIFSETRLPAQRLRLVAMQYVPGATLERLEEALAGRTATDRNGEAMLAELGQLCRDDVALDPAALRDRSELAAADRVTAVLLLGIQVGQALAHAHRKGVLHLDVKPSNILLNRYGRALLTDFNVALDSRGPVQEGAQLGGTFAYMAPEQQEVFRATDRPTAIARLDGRADVFSLGVVLREALGDATLPAETRHVIDRATHPDRSKRYATADALVRALQGCTELTTVRSALPAPDWITRLSSAHPLIAITLFGGLPQFVASLVGTAYNGTRIVSRLSPEQQGLFQSMNLVYSPTLYAIALVVWIHAVIFLVPYLRAPSVLAYDSAGVEKLRRRVLGLPYIGLAITTLGWIPGAVLFPLLLHLRCGPLDTGVAEHLALSFIVSWLIAMSYSFLLHQSIVLRVLYPRFWVGASEVRPAALVELKGVAGRVKLFASLTVLIPLVGAALLLSQGPDMFDPAAYRDFRMLVTALVVLGGAGADFALGIDQKLARATLAFTGRT